MKGSIIYKAKYGVTRQYAEWLSKELDLHIMRPEEVSKNQLREFDFLLIGASVYFGKFKIRNWLKKNIQLRSRKIFLFIVNATAADEQAKRHQFVQDNVPQQLNPACEIFYLPGGLFIKSSLWPTN